MYKDMYKNKLCTKEQLQRYVKLGKLTENEYNQIIAEVDSNAPKTNPSY